MWWIMLNIRIDEKDYFWNHTFEKMQMKRKALMEWWMELLTTKQNIVQLCDGEVWRFVEPSGEFIDKLIGNQSQGNTITYIEIVCR